MKITIVHIRNVFILQFIAVLLATGFSSIAYGASTPMSILINDQRIQARPITVNNSVLVPIRAVMENLGATVLYSKGIVTLTKGDINVSFQADSHVIRINGLNTRTNQPAIVRDYTTYVPIRFIGNAFGYDVIYDNTKKEVRLSSDEHQAIAMGYIEGTDRSVIDDATIRLVDQNNIGRYLTVYVNQGFFRLALEPGTYKFAEIYLSNHKTYILSHDKFTLSTGDRLFFKLQVPDDNVTIHVQYPDGSPIKLGFVYVNNSANSYEIIVNNGIATTYIPAQTTVVLDTIQIMETTNPEWDIYSKFLKSGEESMELILTVQRPNIHITIQDADGPILSGTTAVFSGLSSNPQYDIGYPSSNGSVNVYLPDGSYSIESIDYSSTSFKYLNSFSASTTFNVISGKPDQTLSFTIPSEILGTLSNNDGSVPQSGTIQFNETIGNSVFSHIAEVSNGKFSI